MAKPKRSAGKPGQFKYGTEEWRRKREQDAKRRKRRGFIGRSLVPKDRASSGLAGGRGSPGRRKVKKRGAK